MTTYKESLKMWGEDAGEKVVIFYRDDCHWCDRALMCLEETNLAASGNLVKINVASDPMYAKYGKSMSLKTGCRTLPKTFENGVFLGDSQTTINHFRAKVNNPESDDESV